MKPSSNPANQAIEIIDDKLELIPTSLLEGLEWYLFGGRASGRTFAACALGVRHAIKNPNIDFMVVDHAPARNGVNSYLLEQARIVVSQLPDVIQHRIALKVNSAGYITIRYNPLDIPPMEYREK